MLAKSSPPVLPCLPSLSSWYSSPYNFHFWSFQIFLSSSSIPCSLTFWAFIWYIYIYFLLRTFFLFSPPLKNSCSFFRSEIQSTSWWLLLWMPQVWQRCFSHDLCPIVSSEQELPCAIIAWIFVSTLDVTSVRTGVCLLYWSPLSSANNSNWHREALKFLLNEWMNLKYSMSQLSLPNSFKCFTPLFNLCLTSQAPLTKTAITFPQSSQKFVADKVTYTSQRKRNFSEVLRINIW